MTNYPITVTRAREVIEQASTSGKLQDQPSNYLTTDEMDAVRRFWMEHGGGSSSIRSTIYRIANSDQPVALVIDYTQQHQGPTADQVDAWLRNSKRGFTLEQLRSAFDRVKDDSDWKNPIDSFVPADQCKILEHAIPWFTGTHAEFESTDDPDLVRVMAAGYYAGPCN